jgi:predicted RNA-binding protein with PUA-like domain
MKKPGYWLFKEEPDHYNFADLERDGTTLWDGVVNNLARQHLRQVRRGDRVLYYHTGKEKAVIGEMEVVSDPQTDPTDLDPKAVAVRVKPVRRLQHPVSLTRIKTDPQLADWDLVRLPRLSVLPVSAAQWKRVIELGRDGE